jgi:hypothetical protein
MTLLAWALIVAFLPLQTNIQNPADVTLVLAPKNGKTTFRLGEQIDLEFRLSTTSTRRYLVDPLYRGNSRSVRSIRLITVEPATGTVDPLLDLPATMEGYGGGVMSTGPQYLSDKPIVAPVILNEFVSFRVPGRYRVTGTFGKIGIPLQSNTLEIEIVAAEPGWADATLQEALARLRARTNCQYVESNGRLNLTPQCEAVAWDVSRTLRFLETREAALAMVEFFPEPGIYSREQFRLGLFASPYRKEILEAMEAQLVSPSVPIDDQWLNTMIELAGVAKAGPRPIGNELEERRYQEQFPPMAKHYYDRLADAASLKQGEAKNITIRTLSNRRR